MATNTLRAAIRHIVDLISDGQLSSAMQACVRSRLTEADLRLALNDYGRAFVRPPADFERYIDLIAVAQTDPPMWSVQAPLWTIEEGRSDLTLELTVIETSFGVVVELDDLHVL